MASGNAPLVRPRRETYATAAWRHGFLDDRLRAGVSVLTRDGLSGRLTRVDLRYFRDDGTTIALEADLFDGDGTDVFGQFDQRDRIMLSVHRVLE